MGTPLRESREVCAACAHDLKRARKDQIYQPGRGPDKLTRAGPDRSRTVRMPGQPQSPCLTRSHQSSSERARDSTVMETLPPSELRMLLITGIRASPESLTTAVRESGVPVPGAIVQEPSRLGRGC